MRAERCSKTCSRNEAPSRSAARRGRRGDTGSDSVDAVDAAARDLWVPGPEVRKCILVSSHSCWTSRNMRSPWLGRGRQRLVVASGCQEREMRPCSSSMTAPRDSAVPMQLPIPPTRVAPCSGFVLADRACNRRLGVKPQSGSACSCAHNRSFCPYRRPSQTHRTPGRLQLGRARRGSSFVCGFAVLGGPYESRSRVNLPEAWPLCCASPAPASSLP